MKKLLLLAGILVLVIVGTAVAAANSEFPNLEMPSDMEADDDFPNIPHCDEDESPTPECAYYEQEVYRLTAESQRHWQTLKDYIDGCEIFHETNPAKYTDIYTSGEYDGEVVKCVPLSSLPFFYREWKSKNLQSTVDFPKLTARKSEWNGVTDYRLKHKKFEIVGHYDQVNASWEAELHYYEFQSSLAPGRTTNQTWEFFDCTLDKTYDTYDCYSHDVTYSTELGGPHEVKVLDPVIQHLVKKVIDGILLVFPNEKQPSPLTGLTVVPNGKNTDSLVVSWDKYDGADEYRVEWRAYADTGSYSSIVQPASRVTRRTLSGLAPNTTYDVNVFALARKSPTVYQELNYASATGTTLWALGRHSASPGASPGTLDVSWGTIEHADHYLIIWSNDGDAVGRVRIAAPAVTTTITGLVSGKKYDIEVVARAETDDGFKVLGGGKTSGAPN